MKAAGQGAPPEAKTAAGVDNHYYGLSSAVGLVSQLGVSMFLCVFIGVMMGKRLDGWLGTSPSFLLAGALLGAGASWKVLYDLVIKKWMN